jgi:enterochelin esterase family protein
MIIMKKVLLFLLVLTFALPCAADNPPAGKVPAPVMIAMAQAHSPKLRASIEYCFGAQSLKDGTAWVGEGPEFFFAVEAATAPLLVIDERAPRPMQPVLPAPSGSASDPSLWYAIMHVEPVARLHQFYFLVNGVKLGEHPNLPVFGPLSYRLPGVPTGKLSETIVHTSKIYDGMKSNYWIYVPAEYDPKVPAALMVFLDGGDYLSRQGNNNTLNVIDNLIAQKKIPVMICVFIDPGDISGSPGTPTYAFVKGQADRWGGTFKDAMRSMLYDTVSDRYARFLRDEVLVDVGAKYNLRKDAYSHAITGASSGGIGSFNAAWQLPDSFSRVIVLVGAFASRQWKENPAFPDGGQDYPDKILREPKRNLRIWLRDASDDLENEHWGSLPLNNIRVANALKTRDYDFHFSFGKGVHSWAQGAPEFPKEMMWLWRGYDPAKTFEEFKPDPEEKSKPLFRVAIVNRDSDE